MAYIALALSALLVVIDQAIKWVVSTNMNLYDSIPVWKIGDIEIMNFSYYLNDGAAFSMLEGKRWFLIGITSVAIIIGIGLLVTKKVKKKRYVWTVAVIIGGGIGNLIDRIFNNGLVVDFIDFKIIKFAVFNFADICATGGAIALLVFLVYDEIVETLHKKKALAAEGEASETSSNAEVKSDVAEDIDAVDTASENESTAEADADDGEQQATNSEESDTDGENADGEL